VPHVLVIEDDDEVRRALLRSLGAPPTLRGQQRYLTPKEFDLLRHLAERPGGVVSHTVHGVGLRLAAPTS
jgi:DNA-binding response OmpR family regulator